MSKIVKSCLTYLNVEKIFKKGIDKVSKVCYSKSIERE